MCVDPWPKPCEDPNDPDCLIVCWDCENQVTIPPCSEEDGECTITICSDEVERLTGKPCKEVRITRTCNCNRDPNCARCNECSGCADPDPDGECDPAGGIGTTCSITDTFTRTVSGGWGTSDAGGTWTRSGLVAGASYQLVDGSVAQVQASSPGGYYYQDMRYPINTATVNATWKMKANHSLDEGEPNSGGSMEAIGMWANDNYIELGTRPGYGNYVIDNHATSPWDVIAYHNVDYTNWFHVRLQVDSSQVSLTIWQDGDTEPSSPQLVAESACAPYSYIEVVYALQQDLSSASPLVISVDDFDLAGVNRCSEYRFDNFNRTVTDDWGVSDFGLEWARNFTWTSLDCNGTAGTWTNPGSFTHSQPYIDDGDGIPTPWTALPTFTVTGRFKVNSVLSVPNYSSLNFGFLRVAANQFTNCGVQINTGTGYIGIQAGAGDEDVAFTGWQAGTWYIFKVEMTAGVELKATVYPESSTDPGWLISASDVGYGPLVAGDTNFIVDFYGLGSSTVTVDYIDFDDASMGAAGKGCYKDCSGSMAIDNFDGRTYYGVWGNTSGTNDPWCLIGGGDDYFSVHDGVGHLTLYVPSTSYAGGLITLNEGGSSVGPPYVTGAGVPDWLFTGTGVVYSIDFMCDDLGGPNLGYMEIWLTDNAAVRYEGVMVAVGDYDDTFYFDSYLSAQSRTTGNNWLANTWYTIKVEVIGTTANAKIWKRGEAEPGWTLSRTVRPMPWTVGEFTLFCNSYKHNQTVNWYFDNFIATSCTEVFGDPLPYRPPYGSTSEGFTGGSSTFQLSNYADPPSVTVFVNGIRTPASATFDGLVTLTFTTVATDVITIIYVIGGSGPR
jgi:hypothetical protein